MTRLIMEQITRESENRDVGSVTSLQLSYRAVSDVSCLSNYQNLEKLDLSYNCLTSLEGLSACVNLKWLQVSGNKLATLKGVESLSKLTVLNAGRNKLDKMDEIYGLKNLRALILNDNNISCICKLDQMKYLNTLVLSRNPIHIIGNSLEKAASIIKLSLSHCKLETIGSSLAACVELKEARFSHNEITALPEELAKNSRLRTLDIGNNQIEKLYEIKVLSSLYNLKNLNLLGNPIAENDKLAKKVRRLVPNVRIFNAKRTESSNSSAKISEKSSLYPSKADSFLEISPSVEDIKNRKKRDFKQKDSITDIEFEGKNKSSDCGADAPGNNSNSTTKKKKSKANTQLLENSISGYMEENISPKAELKPKRKSSVDEEGGMFLDIDDPTKPFVHLIFSGKSVDGSEREKGREIRRDARFDGIVIEHHHKKSEKRSKNRDSVLSARTGILFSQQCFSRNTKLGWEGYQHGILKALSQYVL